MPIPFYNTGAPTPSTKNTINSVTVNYGIRDFLLNCNLGLNGGFYPQLAMSTNGGPLIGQPVLDTSINANTNVIPNGLPLEVVGLSRYEIAVLPNQFQNNDPSSPQLVNIDDISTIQGIFGTVDFPQGIQNYPTSPTQQVSEYGLLGKSEYAQFRETSTLRNLYVDATKQVDVGDWISLQPAGFSQQLTGYLDEFGFLNQGGNSGTQTSNVLGSILNGQGIGASNNGLIPNFDLRASLAGRILGATGTYNDTKLGQIGGQQLAFSLSNNAAFNVEQDILGSLNLQDNLLSLVKDGSLAGFRPNYKITVPTSGVGKAFDYAASILGFTLPKSYLTEAGSIFLSENQSGNIDRANSMIQNTGKGQVEALISNVNANIIGSSDYDSPQTTAFRSGYVPGYKNPQGEIAITPSLYAFTDDVTKGTVFNFLAHTNTLIPEISYNRSNMIKKYGFLSPEDTFNGPRGNTGYNNRKVSDVGFTWTSGVGGAVNSFIGDDTYDELSMGETEGLHPKKSILSKTQKLFNDLGMMNIVSAKGDMNKNSSQIETANGGGFSKGSAVIKGNRYSDEGIFDGNKNATAENTYCRSWTTLNRYDSVSKMIKHRDLWRFTYPYRHQLNNSVLDDNGFVKIAPYKTDTFSDTDVKKYMLSIENLAWADNYENLIPCEIGPGDPLSGKKGRIMWFPPYNIQFNENTSVNWEKNDFVGRGESVYTYSNTERSGTLSFQIIVDHPSYANSFAGSNGPDDNYVASFFAGCVEPNAYFRDRLTPSEQQKVTIESVVKPQVKTAPEQTPPPSFSVYFPNDVSSGIYPNYENAKTGSTDQDFINYSLNPDGKGFGIGTYMGEETPGSGSAKTGYTDNYNYGFNYSLLNKPFKVADIDVYGASDPNLISLLNEHITKRCTSCVVEVSGYASKQGSPTYNKKLANDRAKTVIATLKAQIFKGLNMTEDEISKRFIVGEAKEITDSACIKTENSPTDTIACKRDRKAVVTFKVSDKFLPKNDVGPEPVTQTERREITNNIKKRFYSECSYFEKLTQEDNFVFDSFRQKIRYFHPAFHSTTPEGLNSRLTFLQQCTRQGPTLEGQGANNLAFGRPPVCILRIGDFYNTKIIIDTVSIEYEPLVWDLNPEGIGVQPMIANVSLSFKFIGGSTLMGPINKLQNALSFNYYANSQVYDPRADYISKEKPVIKEKGKADREVPDNKTGFYINNTVNDLYHGSSVDYNERNINDVGESQPNINQTASNDVASGAKNPQTEPNANNISNDASKLKLDAITNVESSKQFVVLDVTSIGTISQSYECDVTISSSNGSNRAVYTFPSKIKIESGNKTFSVAVSTLLSGGSVAGLTSLPSDFTTIKVFLNGDQRFGLVKGSINNN